MSGSKNCGTFTQWNTTQQKRKKELLPFVPAWMELESIMLSEMETAKKDRDSGGAVPTPTCGS